MKIRNKLGPWLLWGTPVIYSLAGGEISEPLIAVTVEIAMSIVGEPAKETNACRSNHLNSSALCQTPAVKGFLHIKKYRSGVTASVIRNDLADNSYMENLQCCGITLSESRLILIEESDLQHVGLSAGWRSFRALKIELGARRLAGRCSARRVIPSVWRLG